MYLRSSLEQTLQNESRFFALFAYEYQPESNFFIVYNYNQKKKGKEQILFVKLVYLIKLLGWKKPTAGWNRWVFSLLQTAPLRQSGHGGK